MDLRAEYKLALDAWGEESQIDKCIEEMAELTKALCKYKRMKKFDKNDNDDLKKNLTNIQEEIADVLNTVGQMEYMFGEEEINKIRATKIARTIKKIKK